MNILAYAAFGALCSSFLYYTVVQLMNPARSKQEAALSAVRRTFQRDGGSTSNTLIPYTYYIYWPRLFNLFALKLRLGAPARFAELREVWGIDQSSYHDETLGDWKQMGESASGLSGSLFYRSASNSSLLLKSLNRDFEIQFLHQHFLPVYFDFVKQNPNTLINKVLDVLCSFERRVWSRTPSQFLVLENIASDKDDEWETFDLKPTTYLEAITTTRVFILALTSLQPVRDLLPEPVHPSGVTDVLPKNKPLLVGSVEDQKALLAQLRLDTEFLASLGAVDYSVLVVRKPDGSGRVAIIDVLWSLRTPRARFTKQIR
jgi:hypothetical protein